MSTDPVPIDDMALFACAACLIPAIAAEGAAEARGDDEAFASAASRSPQIVETMARFRAGSVEALLVQARALAWLYPNLDLGGPDADVIDTTAGRLIRALALGPHHLAHPLEDR